MSSNSWLLAVVSCVCLSACFYVRVQCRREGVKSIQNTVVCRSERGSGDRLLHMVVCSSVVTTGQINPFRPKPRHSASESLYDLVSRLLADRTFLGGGISPCPKHALGGPVCMCVCVCLSLYPHYCAFIQGQNAVPRRRVYGINLEVVSKSSVCVLLQVLINIWISL